MAVTFSSDRTFASMSFTLSFANTGVNNPSFIVASSIPNAGPDAAVSVTLQNRIDDARGAIAVVERRERGWLGFIGASGRWR